MAETKTTKIDLEQIDSDLYTQDNLIAGTNISFTESYGGGGIDPDTLACFHFNDAVENVSQYANNDTYAGVDLRTDPKVTYISGKFDKALSMSDYSSDTHTIKNPAYISYYDEMTFEFWIKHKNVLSNATQISLYGLDTQSYGVQNFMTIYGASNTTYIWVVTADGINVNRALTSEESQYVNVGDWNHLALCCKNGSFTKFYINGHLIINDTEHTSLSPSEFSSDDAGLSFVFADPDCGIDELRLSKCLRYTGDSFTVPTEPFNTNYTTLTNINNTMVAPSVMTGATSGAAGTSGLVPAPSAGDQSKYLTGAGTWATISALQNTATGTDSLSLLGNGTTEDKAINIGKNTLVENQGGIAIGDSTKCAYNAVAIGYNAKCANSAGTTAVAGSAIAIGNSSQSGAAETIAIGSYSTVSADYGIAIGRYATTSAQNAIQLGYGTNNTASSLSVGFGSSNNYTLLDGNTGKVPMARLPIEAVTQAEYDALVSGGTVDANTLYLIKPAS